MSSAGDSTSRAQAQNGVRHNWHGTRLADMVTKPIIYIASPYSKGDLAVNVHFQCKIFHRLMDDGKVWPVAPLWTHFQHTAFPRPYRDWIEYDRALLHLYDACLRLNAEMPELGYSESSSSGADGEADYFRSMGKPVFMSIVSLYEWVHTLEVQ